MRFAYVFLASVLFACAPSRRAEPRAPERAAPELETSTPDREGMSTTELVELTTWLRDHPIPIFSLLISRHGRIVYELYTSSLGRDDAHYVMSVTKSVLSALIGIAIDRHVMPGPETSITRILPRRLFASDAEVARLEPLTLERVMGMAGIDAPDPPRTRDAAAVARQRRFWLAPNRVAVALQQPVLSDPFQYNDSTPALAAGALQYAAGKSALEFAEESLFSSLGFRNYEWMHQDAAGLDNGGYGLRLRPIDMQKLGILYLNHGVWKDRQILSRSWIDRSFTPWNRSSRSENTPDYGWFWWKDDYGPGWTLHLADGWKGQRIAVFPEQQIVVTMTGCIEDGTEREVFTGIIKKAVIPSVEKGAHPTDPNATRTLAALVEEVGRGPSRVHDFIEHRMVPEARPKQERRRFGAN